MKDYLLKLYHSQLFEPKWFSLFINPFYFYRKGLNKAIKKYALKLTGETLDFGCGFKPYKRLFVNSKEYIGIDIENPGHDHSQEDVDVYYDGKYLPFDDDSFDSIFSSEVFEHVVDLNLSINELKRVLKPNGLMLVTVPFVWGEHEKPYDFRRFSRIGINQIFKDSGFEIVETEVVSHYVEALFQIANMYIYSFYENKNKNLRLFLNLIFISPLTIIGSILSAILPKNKNLYLGTALLVQKRTLS